MSSSGSLLRFTWVIVIFTVAATSAVAEWEDQIAMEDRHEIAFSGQKETIANTESAAVGVTENYLISEDGENATESFKGAMVFRARLRSKEQRKLLHVLESENLLDIWSHYKGKKAIYDFLVLPGNADEIAKRLNETGVKTSLLIPDVQKLIDDENKIVKETEDDLRAGYALNWDSYFKYGKIHDFLDYYATTYPEICKVQTIGKTVEGKAIKMIKISSGGSAKRPAIFIDGGFHAREWISPATVSYLIRELVENRTIHGASATDIDYHIVPIVNVDGYEFSHTKNRLWRKNRADLAGFCNGVDLNRNFGYKWGTAGSSRNSCANNYAGRSAFSEPEAQALRDYIFSFAPGYFQAYLSFHSYSQVIIYPWGYTTSLTPDSEDLKRVAKVAADSIKALSDTTYKYGSTARLLYAASGNSADWAKAVAEIKYSFTVELPDKGRYGFVLPARFIKPTGRDSVEIVKAVAEELLKSQRHFSYQKQKLG